MRPAIKLLATLCGGLLVLTAGCKPTETPASKGASATPPPVTSEPEPDSNAELAKLGPPSLLTWQEVEGRCEWSVMSPPQLEARLIMVTHTCPGSRFAWDVRGGRSLFELDRHVYLHDWKAAKVEDLGRVPTDAEEIEVGITASGALRVCNYEERAGSEAGADRFRVFMERQANGTWQKTGEEPISYEIEPDPCSGLIGLERAGTVFYDPKAQVANNCTDDAAKQERCPSKAVITELEALIKAQRKERNDGTEYLLLAPDLFIAYPTLFGDTVHAEIPIFSIDKGEIKTLYDTDTGDGEGSRVLLADDYFLVRAEYNLNRASLFRQGEVEPFKEFPAATRVIWIRGTMGPGKVIEVATPSDAPGPVSDD